ncbi:ABC transporter ATP-binding protein [Fusibacter paucivorans]|uniref:ABC transporter ATP-binding protein n=1 Tax=Fusibacter paucivorans TaxID=76009 RepID=A0ABS5PS52_9FIRM|nr:ABC transporter ATP-binding protein [Fusibacter paucivorans]MBS7527913.1 ABC transporter ATP-binding protein [Fusibacter paucivorans]
MGGGMGKNMAGSDAKVKDFNKTLRMLLGYMKPYRVKVGLVIFFALFSTTFSIVGPKLLGKVTTKLAEGLIAFYLQTGLLTDFQYIGKMITLLVVLYIVSAICSYTQSYLMTGVSMRVTYKLRKDISEKMNRIPLNYYDTRTHGEVLSRITNDVDLVNQTLNQTMTQLITSTTMIIGVLTMMLSISWLMTIVALLVVPLTMVIIGVVIKRSQGYFKAQQKHLGELNGHIEEIYGGHTIVQAFNGEADAVEHFDSINDELYHSAWKSQFVSSIMMPVMNFVGNLGYVLVSILGGYLAVKKVVDIGDIQAFIQYMRSFTQPVSQLASISNTLQSTVAAAERVFEFLAEPEEIPESSSPITAEAIHGDVTFDHVSFGYNPEQLIIKDFSAEVKAGQRIAIVGPTGAGKTTIVKLLMRFYDIGKGDISVDGHSIYEFTRHDLRELFGMVLQDTWLYNDTIMENIRYGTPEATDEEVIEAAKAAHCDEFIRALPDGYHMVLNEESSNISQGQKQLFTIARVILANPKILILDEATSSVDTRTEILIQRAMEHLMQNRTSFVIAHRLSTIKDSDLILVMKDGDIVEQGNHDTLLAQNGFYAELYMSQFEE